jgi:hypothetical protein
MGASYTRPGDRELEDMTFSDAETDTFSPKELKLSKGAKQYCCVAFY